MFPRFNRGRVSLWRASLAGVVSCSLADAAYTVNRVVTGLNQPTYITQAPGNNTDLFIVERQGPVGSLGAIVKYNRFTQTKTTFLDITGAISDAGGVSSMAFHPDFQTNGLFYVASMVGTATNRVEAYKVINGTPVFQNTVLQYDEPHTQHTVDWLGFKPNPVGVERNYLYVTAGDGGFQANESGFTNRGQNPATVMGKVLRLNIDPTAADAYAADTNKNFAFPAENPFAPDIPANAGKLKEIFQTGHRNPWRASFDRATGDLYVGDVGFHSKEEIDFTKNDLNFNSGKDYGWAKREGTIPNPIAAHAGLQDNSVNPIYETNHPTFGSLTGGYVYRGPVAELQGKYFFGDFVNSLVWSLNFDRDTDPSTFNGATSGITNAADLTAAFNAQLGASGPIKLITSFGEDNAGNIYIVAMTNAGTSWNPALGTGQIFAILPNAADANTDGKVNLTDLVALANNWQQSGDFNHGDFNFDGTINLDDLSILASNWQTGAGAGPSFELTMAALTETGVNIPEPAAASALGLCLLALRRRIPPK